MSARPKISLFPGGAPDATDRMEQILAGNVERLCIFHRGGELVRIITLPKAIRNGLLSRPRGTVQFVPLSVPALIEIFEREATWWKWNNQGKEQRADCPRKIAQAYLSRVGAWLVPELLGVIEAPIVLPGGRVTCRKGYEASTGLYLTEDWPEITGRTNLKDAQAALKRLLEPFQEFPFVGDEDRAVLVAGILTAFQRRILLSAPLFGFTAPVQRTGKSLLAEAIAIIATGREATAMAVSEDRNEMKKAVLACLREGHSIVNLDNIEHALASPDLSRAITQRQYGDRVLGESRVLHLPTNILWTATGNNLTLRGDLTVRTLLGRLDSGQERPEERRFAIENLKAHLTKHRSELVIAAVTILRAHELAGRPDLGLKPWGGFEEWSAVVRGAAVWAGMADPCQTRKYVMEDDPEREEAAALLKAWQGQLGSDRLTIAKVVESCQEAKGSALDSAVKSVCGGGNGAYDSRKLGWWCRKWRGRVVEKLRLIKSGSCGNAVEWSVVPVGGPMRYGSGVSGVIASPATNSQKQISDGLRNDSDNSNASNVQVARVLARLVKAK